MSMVQCRPDEPGLLMGSRGSGLRFAEPCPANDRGDPWGSLVTGPLPIRSRSLPTRATTSSSREGGEPAVSPGAAPGKGCGTMPSRGRRNEAIWIGKNRCPTTPCSCFDPHAVACDSRTLDHSIHGRATCRWEHPGGYAPDFPAPGDRRSAGGLVGGTFFAPIPAICHPVTRPLFALFQTIRWSLAG